MKTFKSYFKHLISHEQIIRNKTFNTYFSLVSMVENLSNLTTLYVANNKLNETATIEPLRECESLSTIDLSRNLLHDSNGILILLRNMRKLSVLYMHGNPLVRSISSYRMEMILNCVIKF